MHNLRRDASGEVKGIVESAKTLSDWRYYVKHHPWVCVGAAAALGFALTPKRTKAPAEDAKELIALLKQNHAGGPATSAPAKGFAATLVGMAAPFVMRAAMRAAQQQFAGGGPWASLFGKLGPRPARFDDDDGDQPGDEAAFHDFKIPR